MYINEDCVPCIYKHYLHDDDDDDDDDDDVYVNVNRY